MVSEPLTVLQRLARLEERAREFAAAQENFEAAINSIHEELDLLEKENRELAAALLAYVQADIASPWLAPANRLAALLGERLK